MRLADQAECRKLFGQVCAEVAARGGTVTEACELFALALRDAVVDSWRRSPLDVRFALLQALLAKLFAR